jgi:hypothetical protein
MLFRDYKANFDTKRAALKFPAGTTHEGVGCETKVRPYMPPWMTDWAILYPDGMHIRVKEYYKPKPHPLYNHGERAQFSFQYGATTTRDKRGMPRTASDHDTIIRIDRDQFGPHLFYDGTNHIKQESLEGPFVIDNVELFQFIEAVETHRQSSGCPMEDIFLFSLKLKKAARR